MTPAAIIGPALLLLAGLLYFEHKNHTLGKLLTKTPLSGLFLLAALTTPWSPVSGYAGLVLAGLAFCLLGDFCLALPSKKTFQIGLAAFLSGHVLYVIAFSRLAPLSQWPSLGAGLVLAVSAVVFLRLRPYLGAMAGPVLLYVLVISLMVGGAWAVYNRTGLDRTGASMILAGAALFYFSDIFVARDRFVKREIFNRRLGLPMYYAGQFLLAFSVWIE
ncbi:MAG: lysoplasmalogenase [Thermodesulfobacteriota bacterium]